MSAAESQTVVLSREELSALFEGGGRDVYESRPLRALGLADAGAARAQLADVALRFAEEQSRSLSTLHQTSIRFRFTHWEEITLRQFASAMLQTDRVPCIDLGRGHSDAYLLLSRPLVFGWMMLAFGAQPGSGNDHVPSRTYTRIEERFLQRAATDVAQTFAKALGGSDADGRVLSLAPPASLHDRAKRPYLVASFEVDGLGDLCRMRLALPNALLDKKAETPSAPVSSERMAEEILDMSVELRVQVGFADVSLSAVASLRPGDELGLQRTTEDGLVILVEDLAKFRAESGSAGGRLAVRIKEAMPS